MKSTICDKIGKTYEIMLSYKRKRKKIRGTTGGAYG